MSLCDIGHQIRERRKLRGFSTQQALGEASGVHRTRISQMENGRFRGRLTDLLRVTTHLGLDLNAVVVSRPTMEDLERWFPDDE